MELFFISTYVELIISLHLKYKHKMFKNLF